MKVLCVTGNPCIDRLIWHHGDRSRPSRIFTQVGGKGANVSRILSQLPGVQSIHLTTWQEDLQDLLDREPNAHKKPGSESYTVPVYVETPMRLLPNYVDLEKRETFLDYNNLNAVTPKEADRFVKEYKRLLKEEKPDMVILSGSTCKGLGGTYPVMIRAAKKMKLPVILDSHGEGFELGLPEGPDFIKPNREEMESTLGKIPKGGEVEAARKLIDMGAGAVLLTMGGDGCMYITKETAESYPVIKVPAINPIGCGDSFIAYFAYGYLLGLPVRRCIEMGTAAGAANAASSIIGRISPRQVNRILAHAGLEKLPQIQAEET